MNLPAFGGNWVDAVIIFFLIFSLFSGWQRGFLGGLFDLLGFLLSFLLALKFYPLAADQLATNFSLSLGIAKALGFFLIAVLVEIVLSLSLSLVHSRIPLKIKENLLNRFFGLLPVFCQTSIFIAFVLALTLALPVRGSVKKDVLSSRIGGELVGGTQGLERQLSQVFGGAIEETLNFFTVKPESKETVDLKFSQKELTVDQAAEKEMLQLVNKERQEKGLGILAWDERLTLVARVHAKDMFERGYFSHITPEGLSPADRLEASGISFFVTGENLALAPSVGVAHQGLMDSPGHRANILSEDYGRVGIGVMDGGIYGKMFVQEFTD